MGVPDPAMRFSVYPHELSGGLRQRVMAAIAMAGKPALVVADEPTTALDVTVQAQLLDLLRELRDEHGCSVVLITHDLGVASQIADRIAVMYAGRLAEVGPAAAVLTAPAHPYTTGLMQSRLSLRLDRDSRLPTLPTDTLDPPSVSSAARTGPVPARPRPVRDRAAHARRLPPGRRPRGRLLRTRRRRPRPASCAGACVAAPLPSDSVVRPFMPPR